MKIGGFLGVFFLIFSFFVVSSPVFAAKPSPSPNPGQLHKRIVIGANLKEYKPPAKRHCDIKVPAQYNSIQAAVNAAVNGDTVCVGAGTYNENVFINKSIRLSGKGAKKSIINGQIQPQNGTVIISATNVIIEGFRIYGLDLSWAMALYQNNSDTVVQYNWIVAGNEGIALFTENQQNNILIQNNILEGDNSPYVAQTDTATYLNNIFVGTVNPSSRQDTGITLNCQGPSCLIKHNVFNTSGPMLTLIAVNIDDGSVNENNFSSNTIRKVSTTWSEIDSLNTENNWWGDLDPSDNIQGSVDYIPFATRPFAENNIPKNW